MIDSEPTPTDADLVAFDRGLLSDEATEAVVRWLVAHPEGEDRLRQLTESCPDDAIAALRAPNRIGPELEHLTGVAERVIDRLLDTPNLRDVVRPSALPETIRDYRLLGPLGQGGMGSVYRARHLRLQREVAIKLLPPHMANDRAFRPRFEREMALVGQLDHPNLVRAHDAGVEGDQPFLVMELLDGRDLNAIVAERGKLEVADACEAIRQAALGLHHAHEHGIVHRDVKPSNLILTRSGVVKVIDLGLGRGADDKPGGAPLSSAQTVMGTPEYMAPEQWEQTRVGPAADLYGLGCTLYCLLAGKPPFQRKTDDTWVTLLDAHRTQPPPPLRERGATVPAPLEELLARMLAKAPADRPASAKAIAQALKPFAAAYTEASRIELLTEQARAAKPLPPTPSPSWHGRVRARWRFVAVGVVGILALGLAIRSGTRPVVPAGPAPIDDAMPESNPTILKPAHRLGRHTDEVLCVAFDPKGRYLATAGADRTILLWDAKTWKPRPPLLGHPNTIQELAFAPDGRTLASVTGQRDDATIRLWDVETGKAKGTLGGSTSGNFVVAYVDGGTSLICAGWDKTVRVFDVATGQERLTIPDVIDRHVRGVAVSRDGRWIVTGGGGPTRLWDATTRQEVPSQFPHGWCPTFLPGDRELTGWAHGTGRVTICEMPPGEERRTWRAHPTTIEGLTLSPCGRFLATLGADGGKLWSVADERELVRLVGHRGKAYAAAFTSDGRRIATTGLDDAAVLVFDLPETFHVK